LETFLGFLEVKMADRRIFEAGEFLIVGEGATVFTIRSEKHTLKVLIMRIEVRQMDLVNVVIMGFRTIQSINPTC